MKIIVNNAYHYKAICPLCKSILEVTTADEYYSSYKKKWQFKCICCGKEGSWSEFISEEEENKRLL